MKPVARIHDDFLGKEFVQELLAFVAMNRGSFEPTTVGNGRELDESFRRSSYLEDMGPARKRLLSRVRDWLPEVIPALGLQPFRVHDMETQLVAHGDGAFYSPHVDVNFGVHRSSHAHDRMVSIVYYFHREPAAFSGGTLRIHPVGTPLGAEAPQEVEPLQDRAVAFPSWVPHEVLPVRCAADDFMASRFAVNCWVLRE